MINVRKTLSLLNFKYNIIVRGLRDLTNVCINPINSVVFIYMNISGIFLHFSLPIRIIIIITTRVLQGKCLPTHQYLSIFLSSYTVYTAIYTLSRFESLSIRILINTALEGESAAPPTRHLSSSAPFGVNLIAFDGGLLFILQNIRGGVGGRRGNDYERQRVYIIRRNIFTYFCAHDKY